MTKNECNGWFNYETWLVNLWIDNDEGMQDAVRDFCQEAYDEASEEIGLASKIEQTVNKVAKWLEELHDDMNPAQEAGVFADLLSASLREVNWEEIARHHVNAVEEQQRTA